MDFKTYQKKANKTAIYPKELKLIYPTLGLTGEAGEVSEKIKKLFRDNDGVLTDEIVENIKKELGDVLWYISALSTDLGISLDDVAETNIRKLKRREENNTINGDGDNR